MRAIAVILWICGIPHSDRIDRQRKAHVKKLATTRAEIQKKIVEASKRRDAFVVEKQKAMPAAAADTFGEVVEEAVEEQLDAFGFDVE